MSSASFPGLGLIAIAALARTEAWPAWMIRGSALSKIFVSHPKKSFSTASVKSVTLNVRPPPANSKTRRLG
jgi:hypothetical protein